MDWLIRSPYFIQFVVLLGLALSVSLTRWGWLAWRGRDGGVARLQRAPFFRPCYTLSDGPGWARLEVRAPPLAAFVLLLGLALAGLGAVRQTPDRTGWTSTARMQAELVVVGLLSTAIALACGTGRVDVRVEVGGGLEVRRSRALRGAERWTVPDPREVSILVAPAGALKVEVHEDDGAGGTIADRRFYFGGQFDDDDPSVDRDLAVASEVFTAVASGKRG